MGAPSWTCFGAGRYGLDLGQRHLYCARRNAHDGALYFDLDTRSRWQLEIRRRRRRKLAAKAALGEVGELFGRTRAPESGIAMWKAPKARDDVAMQVGVAQIF